MCQGRSGVGRHRREEGVEESEAELLFFAVSGLEYLAVPLEELNQVHNRR
jgi:hypothetical protein